MGFFNYSVAYPSTATASPPKTLVGISEPTNAPAMPELYEWLIGSPAAPVAQQSVFDVLRFTAVGTAGSNPTVEKLHPSAPTAITVAGIGAYSVEPTYAGGSLLTLPVNQQSTYRWVVQPNVGLGLFMTKTASNGLGCKCTAVNTAYNVQGHVLFTE